MDPLISPGSSNFSKRGGAARITNVRHIELATAAASTTTTSTGVATESWSTKAAAASEIAPGGTADETRLRLPILPAWSTQFSLYLL